MHRITRRFSPSMAVALLALFFAFGGGAYAAKHYLITSTKQIKPSVLKQLRGAVGKTGATGPAGPQGPQGVAGTPGAPGAPGGRGPSDVYYNTNDAESGFGSADSVALALPAGDYEVHAVGAALSSGSSPTNVFCNLNSPQDTAASHIDSTFDTLAAGAYSQFGGQTIQHLPSGGTVTFSCPAVTGIDYDFFRITAIQTGTLH